MNHWLLNTAVEFPVPILYFFPKVSQALNVKPMPGCTSEDYARGLIGLFDLGMITFSSKTPGDDTANRAGILQILKRFQELPIEDGTLPSYKRLRLSGMEVAFKLTTLGGEAWEKLAQPDWARYVSTSLLPARSGDLISADRDLLFAYMEWYPEVNREQIQLETIRWQEHTDFKIVYWKRLPFVYHASFEVTPAESRWVNGQPKWFSDWWISTCSWHKQPWDLPGWPSE